MGITLEIASWDQDRREFRGLEKPVCSSGDCSAGSTCVLASANFQSEDQPEPGTTGNLSATVYAVSDGHDRTSPDTEPAVAVGSLNLGAHTTSRAYGDSLNTELVDEVTARTSALIEAGGCLLNLAGLARVRETPDKRVEV